MRTVDYSYACELCSRKGFSKVGYYVHLKKVHRVEEEKARNMYSYLFSENEMYKRAVLKGWKK